MFKRKVAQDVAQVSESGGQKFPPFVIGKSHRTHILRCRSSERASGLLDLIRTDMCGPIEFPFIWDYNI